MAGLFQHWRPRKPTKRAKHPTPEQALHALSDGRCMYALISPCSGRPSAVGLRDESDINDVLVCKAHYGRLRKLDGYELEKLERVLVEAFLPVGGRRRADP